jgi:hypothetical protein
VEDFSVNRLMAITNGDVSARARAFRELVNFDVESEHFGQAAR